MPECPFIELLEEDDNHCLLFNPNQRNEVLSCDNLETYKWLSHIRNVGFDVIAKPTPPVSLPLFIPVVPHGSKGILAGSSISYVATSLREVVSPKKLLMPTDIRKRLGVSKTQRIMLLSYGRDKLIEQMWSKRKEVFKNLAALDFDLVTAVNYSVWLNDPHAERLINIKRSLITFEDMQKLNIPTIPHIYWFGEKDLQRWGAWLLRNKNVKIVAINLQTEKGKTWDRTLKDLEFFVSIIDRPLHFFITGATTPNKARQIKNIFPSLSLSNGSCSRKASSGFLIKEKRAKIHLVQSKLPRNEIFQKNVEFYENILSE